MDKTAFAAELGISPESVTAFETFGTADDKTTLCGCLDYSRASGADTIMRASRNCTVEVITSSGGRVTSRATVTIGAGNELRLKPSQGVRCV